MHIDQTAETSPGRPDRVTPGDNHIGSSVEALKQAFIDNLYYIVGRYPAIANRRDSYIALAYTVRDRLMERWINAMQTYRKEDVRVCMADLKHDEWTERLADGRIVKFSYGGSGRQSWAKAEVEGEALLRINGVLAGFLNRSGVEALFADDLRQKVLN
jgi:hypothetical protein